MQIGRNWSNHILLQVQGDIFEHFHELSVIKTVIFIDISEHHHQIYNCVQLVLLIVLVLSQTCLQVFLGEGGYFGVCKCELRSRVRGGGWEIPVLISSLSQIVRDQREQWPMRIMFVSPYPWNEAISIHIELLEQFHPVQIPSELFLGLAKQLPYLLQRERSLVLRHFVKYRNWREKWCLTDSILTGE